MSVRRCDGGSGGALGTGGDLRSPCQAAAREPTGRHPEPLSLPPEESTLERRRAGARSGREARAMTMRVELPRFGGHLSASGPKPGVVRFGCRERGRGIRRSSAARRSGSRCWATSRSVSWPGIWGSPRSRCATGSSRSGPSGASAPGGLSSDEREERKSPASAGPFAFHVPVPSSPGRTWEPRPACQARPPGGRARASGLGARLISPPPAAFAAYMAWSARWTSS